ncbi:MAG: PAS domain S-box protein [Gallionella sp.]
MSPTSNFEACLKLLDAHTIVITIDASGIILECNDNFCQISGYTREELIGKSNSILKSENHPASFYNTLNKTITGGEGWHGEICNRCKDGSYFWLAASITTVLDEKGIPDMFLTVGSDITASKEPSNNFGKELVNSMPGIFYMLDPAGRFISWNTQLEHVTQYSNDEISRCTALDLFVANDRKHVEHNIRKAFKVGETSVEGMLKAKDGTKIPYHFTGKRIIQDSKPVLIGLGTDVSNRKQAEATARKSSEELAAIFDSSQVSIAYLKNNVIVKNNRKFDEIFGYELGELIGQKTQCLYPDEASYRSITSGALPIMTLGESYQRTMEMRRKNGTPIWARISGSPLSSSLSRGSVWTYEDVTAEYHAKEKIHNMAFYDGLTQLPNRRMLDDRLEQALAVSKRRRRFGAVIFLGLDNFKPLNDKHGHTVGDLLLVEVAHRLTDSVREVDTVARFGGDEFVVMLNELDVDESIASSQAASVAEKIRLSLSEMYTLIYYSNNGTRADVQHHCSVSIGVMMFSNHDSSSSDILKWADMAMYQAKGLGRNKVQFFAPELQDS